MELSGLVLNKNIGTYPPNSWSFAKNVTISTDGKAIFNEGGFDTVVTGIVGSIMGSIAIGNTTILFSTNGVVHNIGKLVGSTYTLIVSDPAFNFDLQHPVYGVATYNHKGEIVISFIDDYNSPKVLNIDVLPFPSGVTTITKLLTNGIEFTLCETFPSLKNPIVSTISVNDGGGNLLSGTYYAVVANRFNDNSATSWQEISNPIFITDDLILSSAVGFSKYDGCIANTPTSKSITLNLVNLDTNFNKFKVGIISKLNGIISAYETDVLYYTGTTATVVITTVNNLTLSSYKELITPNSIYTKVRGIALINDRVHLANLTGLPILDFQSYANDMIVQWYRKDHVSLDTVEYSYKDSKILFTKKQFKSGEVYALYAGLRLKRGGYYGVYHIPGREILGSESGDLPTAVLSSTPFNTLAAVPKKYQFLDTSTDESTTGTYGKMSYWENANEVYPDDFADFAGQKVRHHKFPTLSRLEYYKSLSATKGFITPLISGGVGTQTIDGVNSINRIATHVIFSGVTASTYGTWSLNNTQYTATSRQIVTLDLEIYTDSESRTGDVLVTNVTKYDINNTAIRLGYERGDVIVTIAPFVLEIGERVLINSNTVIACTIYNTTKFTMTVAESDESLSGTLFTQPLGLQISNVVIPDSIKAYVDGWEIFYAERTVENMTIVGQDILYGDTWIAGNYDYNNIRLHAFDLMTNRLSTLPTYLDRQLDFYGITENIADPTSGAVTNFLSTTYTHCTSLSLAQKILPITIKGYLPALIDSVVYDNTKREDTFLVSTVGTIINTAGHRYLADICCYKTDVYRDYQNQVLVSTGIFINTTDDVIQPTVHMYGGDTVVSRYTYRLDYVDATPKYLMAYIVAETISNANLRNEGTDATQIYYPKSDIADLFTVDAIAAGNWWGYNTDYNSINNNVQPVIIYPNINLTTTHPNRIARSLPKQTESVALNWRIFLVADYYELTSDKGYINSLTTATDKILYIATRYSLFIAKVKDTIDTTSGALAIKEGDLFDRDPQEVISDKLGYIGNTNRFATFICKYGYFTIDSEKGKVYLINENVEEIATDTVSEFLKLYLPTSTDDNPFTEIGLSAGYDDVNDRILITVNNRVAIDNSTSSSVTTNVIAIANKSYTISLNLKHKRWVAFHDYLINHYITTRTGILGVVNNGGTDSAGLTADIFSLNSVSVFCKYPTTIKNSFIDFIFDANNKAEELIENIAYDAEIKSGDVTYWDKTLSKLMISTKQQCSGEITLGIQTWSNQLTTGNIKNIKGIWIINKFKDRSVSTNVAFLDVEGAVVSTNLENEFVTSVIYGKKYIVSGILTAADYITYNSVNYTNNGDMIIPVSGVTAVSQIGFAKIKNFKYWYEMSNIITNFAVVRLKYDNSEQLTMKVNNIILNVK